MTVEPGGRPDDRAAPAAPSRRARSLGRRSAAGRPRRSPGAIATSVVLHGALTLFLVQALELPAPLTRFFTRGPAEFPVERVAFVEPRRPAPEPEPAPAGPARPAPAAPVPTAPRPAPPRLVAPVDVPDGVAPAPAAPATPTPVDDGRGVVGAGGDVGGLPGAAAGLRPSYTGSVVWRRPLFDYETPANLSERLDSAVRGDLAAVRDSIMREATRRRPTDWTFERNGQRYGIDERFIRLGRISIPTALLGLLPVQQQANPTDLDRARRSQQLGGESRDQARRSAANDDFDARVKSIRERRDRERAERRGRATGQGTSTASPPDR